MHIYRWDLDKTYLSTDFDSAADLIRTALQSAEEKQNIPGTSALMRELRRDERGTTNRIHVISGSPRQMRRVLSRKLRLDGVSVDSLTLKPNLKNALRLRFRALRDQLGYKLPALLESRAEMTTKTRETCFGDDAEMDGVVYRLYSDLCAGRVDEQGLEEILRAARLYDDQASRIREAVGRIKTHDPVERILIHLETGSPTGRFLPLGPRVVPTFNTFQASLILFTDGRLSEAAVGRVAHDMLSNYGYDGARLRRSAQDLVRRGRLTLEEAEPALKPLGIRLERSAPQARPPQERPVPYTALLAEIHSYRAQQKAGRRRPRLSRLLGVDE